MYRRRLWQINPKGRKYLTDIGLVAFDDEELDSLLADKMKTLSNDKSGSVVHLKLVPKKPPAQSPD